MDIGENSSSGAAQVSRPILVMHLKDENLAYIYLSICLVNSALGSLSWSGTRALQDSPRNSLISSISGSTNTGLASSSIPSAFFFAWTLNFDKFFSAAFC